MKNFESKITVLVSYSVHDNLWEVWLGIIEFSVAAMLNSSLKIRFIKEFSKFNRIKTVTTKKN